MTPRVITRSLCVPRGADAAWVQLATFADLQFGLCLKVEKNFRAGASLEYGATRKERETLKPLGLAPRAGVALQLLTCYGPYTMPPDIDVAYSPECRGLWMKLRLTSRARLFIARGMIRRIETELVKLPDSGTQIAGVFVT